MSTQLRLLTKPAASTTATAATTSTRPSTAAARPLRGRVTSSRRPAARRAVHWQGQWRLDAHTREIGLTGVASARAALARAHGDDDAPAADGLRQAS